MLRCAVLQELKTHTTRNGGIPEPQLNARTLKTIQPLIHLPVSTTSVYIPHSLPRRRRRLTMPPTDDATDKVTAKSAPPATSKSILAFEVSDGVKKFAKRYRTEISSGTSTVMSTFTAVCHVMLLSHVAVLMSCPVPPRLRQESHAIVRCLPSSDRSPAQSLTRLSQLRRSLR